MMFAPLQIDIQDIWCCYDDLDKKFIMLFMLLVISDIIL